jgi:hypothetical protein
VPEVGAHPAVSVRSPLQSAGPPRTPGARRFALPVHRASLARPLFSWKRCPSSSGRTERPSGKPSSPPRGPRTSAMARCLPAGEHSRRGPASHAFVSRNAALAAVRAPKATASQARPGWLGTSPQVPSRSLSLGSHWRERCQRGTRQASPEARRPAWPERCPEGTSKLFFRFTKNPRSQAHGSLVRGRPPGPPWRLASLGKRGRGEEGGCLHFAVGGGIMQAWEFKSPFARFRARCEMS